MKIINGRYKIVELLNQNRSYSIYEAVDMIKGIIRVNLCILNTTHIDERLLEFCVSKFEKISNVDKVTTVNILDFGVVINSDNRNKKENYYYTTEWVSEYKPLLEYVEGISEDALVYIFSEVCKLAHSQYQSYHKIIPFQAESIYVTPDLKVKLKDEITVLLDYREIGITNYYKDDEDVIEGVGNKGKEARVYMSKITEILVNIVMGNKGKYKDREIFKKIIGSIANNEHLKCKSLFGDRLYILLCELCDGKDENRNNNILDIIEIINNPELFTEFILRGFLKNISS